MKHTVLARKWRPKKFADLVGQQNCIKVLVNTISTGRLHHAYLLTGTRGVGKTTIARIIAKALNCLSLENGEPCGICENCLQIDHGGFVDIIEIDAASNTGVDNIRELIDNAQYAPTSGQYKIYIIDEVHMLSKSAFNAMLKTLEEPPRHVIFILATTDLQKVPITVISRCLQLKLRNLLVPEISQYLTQILTAEQEAFEKEAIDLIAKAANGSMRDSLSILDQAIAFSDKLITANTVRQMLGLTNDDIILTLLDSLANLNNTTLIQHVESIYNNGHDLEDVLSNFQQKLCEISLAQLANHQITPELKPYITQISINDVQLYFEIASLGIEQLRKSNDKYPVFVMTMLRMLAFHIGTNTQKNTLVHSSNFNVEIANQPEPVPTPQPNLTPPVVPSIIEESIKDSQIPEEPTLSIPKNSFDGNWISLIAQLKDKLGSTLFPFVENSKLNNFNNYKFDLTVDLRYQSTFDSNRIMQLQQILSSHFTCDVEVSLQFAESVTQTLKEKTILETTEKQQNAIESIHNDEYLIRLCQQFNGQIISSSIKPIN